MVSMSDDGITKSLSSDFVVIDAGEFVSLEQAGEVIAAQTKRIQDLLEHNTALTERARKAEEHRDALLSALLSSASVGGRLAQELQREIEKNTKSV